MRYYSLKIGTGFGEGMYFDSKKTGTPLNIEFDIQIFSANVSQVIGNVTLYNVSLEYFIKAKSFIGLPLELRAGFTLTDLTGPGYLDYAAVANDVIFRGRIANVLGEFSGIQSSVTFFFIPLSGANGETSASQTGKFAVTLNNGDKIAAAAQKAVDKANEESKTPILLNVLSSAASLIYGGGGAVVQGVTIAKFLFELNKVLAVGSTQKEAKQLKYYCDHLDTINLYSGEHPVKEAAAAVLNSRELLKQPELINIAGNLALIVRLRADLYVGRKVRIRGATPQLNGIKTTLKTLPGAVNTTQLFFTGEYVITSIHHMGEYYNRSADAWSTQLELAPDAATSTAITGGV